MALEFDLELPRKNFLLKIDGRFDAKTVGIFGPSGAGKTTFFNLLCGLIKPDAGRIVLNGRVLTDTSRGVYVPPQKRGFGVVFQEKLLFPHMTIKENLLFGIKYGKRETVSFEEAARLLELDPVLSSMPGEASGGERQRAAIGRALLSGPELLLLDEPFNAVDTALRRMILPYLRKIRDELDIPILVISHDLPDIQALTDNIFLLEKGSCGGFGSVSELLAGNTAFAKETTHVNALDVCDIKKSPGGLFSCRLSGTETRITASSAPLTDRGILTIRPEEISLSLSRISGISIQNQVPGKVQKIVKVNGSVFCIIDAGIPFIVKVTADALSEMNLRTGIPLFCLFKAHSLKW